MSLERRTEMKRTEMPRRRSNKARKAAAELDAITPQLVERAGYQCEARTEDCLGIWWSPAEGKLCDPRFNRHHLAGRVGPMANDLSRLLLVCGSGTTGCHGWIHRNIPESREKGWLLRRVT